MASALCHCLKITYKLADGVETTIQVNFSGEYNGYYYWEFVIDTTTYTIWHDTFDNWYVTTDGVGGSVIKTGLKVNNEECPFASMPVWTTGSTFDVFTTEACENGCGCVHWAINFTSGKVIDNDILASGVYDSYNYYEFDIYTMWFSIPDNCWYLTTDGLGGTNVAAQLNLEDSGSATCPFSDTMWNHAPTITSISTYACTPACTPKEDRIYRKFDAFRFPEIFQEEDRGFVRCCCPFIVLASPDQSETWKNDVTSAWIKLSSSTDSASCTLVQDGIVVETLTPNAFINDENAFYWTVKWQDVIQNHGPGCYKIMVNYSISGIEQEFMWGMYHLKKYTVHNALKTARIRVIFNGKHEIEGINFAGSSVEDSIRFYGYIGNRQPNTEIDNLIYQNREMKSVIRENLNSYELITDPTCEQHTTKLTDLYLLSENELYISDYNAHNHSYKYLDLPAIVEESPEIVYFDFSREAGVKCKLSDKFKNKRTYYNG